MWKDRQILGFCQRTEKAVEHEYDGIYQLYLVHLEWSSKTKKDVWKNWKSKELWPSRLKDCWRPEVICCHSDSRKKNHQIMLIWKTHKEEKNNINNNNNNNNISYARPRVWKWKKAILTWRLKKLWNTKVSVYASYSECLWNGPQKPEKVTWGTGNWENPYNHTVNTY